MVLIRWAIVIIVRFENSGLRSVAWRSASVSTSTAAVASSRTRILEGARRARASETSWRWPWERLDPLQKLKKRGVSLCLAVKRCFAANEGREGEVKRGILLG